MGTSVLELIETSDRNATSEFVAISEPVAVSELVAISGFILNPGLVGVVAPELVGVAALALAVFIARLPGLIAHV